MWKTERAVRPNGAILTRFQYMVLSALCDNEELTGQPDRRDKLSTAAYRLPWKVKPANTWMRFTQHCGLLAVAGMVTKKKVRHKVTTYTLTEYGINVLFNDSWYYDA